MAIKEGSKEQLQKWAHIRLTLHVEEVQAISQ
jgi:hypothetical protein